MATERLSKLQKWILIQAYKKTICYDNSNLELPQYYQYHNDHLKDKNNEYWQYLFRAEVLLNYFKLETGHDHFSIKQHPFKGNNNKEHVVLTRSLQNLYNKGLIDITTWPFGKRQGIKLTEKGKGKTLLLIK